MLKFVFFGLVILMVVLAVVGIRKAVRAYRKDRAITKIVKQNAKRFETHEKLSPIAEYYAANVTIRL